MRSLLALQAALSAIILCSAAVAQTQADLERALANEDAAVIRSLIGDGDKALPKLATVAKSEDTRVRLAVVYVLGAIGTPASGKTLEPMLNDAEEQVRDEAVVALLYVHRPTSFALHGEPLFEGDIKPITNLGARALPGLEMALSHRTYAVRVRAAHALGFIKDPRVVDVLKRNFSKLDFWALYYAGQTLTKHPDDKRIYPLLISRIDEQLPDYELSATGVALKDLRYRSLPYLEAALRVKPPNNGQLIAAEVVGSIGGERAEPILILASSNENQYVRGRAANFLRNYRTAKSREALKRLVKDKSEYVRSVAKESLAQIGN